MRSILRLAVGVFVALNLAACATRGPAPACPDGQQRLRTAQMFFGRKAGDEPVVSDEDFRKFVDTELTPRFPDGLTILEGGGQWRGAENKLIREASKIVLIILPPTREASHRIEAVRNAYKARFHQESVLLVTQAACVSF